MALPKFFRPVPELNAEERQRGLNNMTRQVPMGWHPVGSSPHSP
jgi:hypothetical protein